jgi:hypothetical protein
LTLGKENNYQKLQIFYIKFQYLYESRASFVDGTMNCLLLHKGRSKLSNKKTISYLGKLK